MNFVIYDLAFLALFVLAFVIFLTVKKHNLKRQGLLYLYRTNIGIKFIDWTSKKYKNILKPLQYVVIASGYTLMSLMIWLIVKFSYVYLTSATAARDLKVPVLIPLIPYLPALFKISFLPPFYFAYWILIIAIIAIPHEFAHGIFARLNKIKVHSTGFGFLGPFLAAFVEPDEKQMAKSSKFSQLSILAAGTFANVLTTILFIGVLWLFFISSFTAAGVNFNTYSSSVINTSQITDTYNYQLDGTNLIAITSNNITYYTTSEALNNSASIGAKQILVFDDSPALKARLSGSIQSIDGQKTTSFNELSSAIQSYSPNDTVKIQTIDNKEIKEFDIKLSEREGKAFLGIGIIPPQSSGIAGKVYSLISKIKDPLIYYESNLGDLGIFIYDFLWWTILICLSVALVNMLPVGIFDGGRFFFITIFALTKSEKIAKKAFSISTWLILMLVAALMIKWVLIFF